MSYHNAADILPAALIQEIQKYADGQYLYIPRKEQSRRQWGDNTHTRVEIAARNRKIAQEYASGYSIRELSQRYWLAEKTIESILRRQRNRQEG